MESRPRRRLSPELRRAQILDAARLTLDGRDPDDLTFEEIASAAGVSRALVYNYFGDKGGLMAELYLATLEELDHENMRILREDRADELRLRSIISNYVTYAQVHADAWNLVTSAAAASHPAIRAARRRRLDELGEAWGEVAVVGRLRGSAVFTFLEASVHEWNDLAGLDVERAIDTVNDLLWNGLGPRPPHVATEHATGPAA